jgi:hypothetical protein
MSERFHDFIEDAVVGTQEKRHERLHDFFKVLSASYDEGGYRAVSLEAQDMAGIKPEFVQAEKDPKAFEAMREKLMTERGLVISNHPNALFDMFSVLQALSGKEGKEGDREDVLVLVADRDLDIYKECFDEKRFIAASDFATPSGFKKILAHMEDGGLLILFPTGGDEQGNDLHFKDGLEVLMKKMKPDMMVYSFYIDADDVKKVQSHHPELLPGMLSEVKFGADWMNLNRVRSAASFRVNEAYTKVEDWHDVLYRAHRSDKAADDLAGRYLSQFGELVHEQPFEEKQ